ncbi:Qdr3p [Sugiyamaella lignohabitans]|uniref:Qdr3p n=1 Tax=Sugiyamaella lignohabitans TaxID=796027 RepID=A0A167DUI6_9ASCO|nr:Qdr3p [Sugiyamaella lignohabitans]ANB13305.1 Qdr3p [Sugiyamaella lignohabitans]
MSDPIKRMGDAKEVENNNGEEAIAPNNVSDMLVGEQLDVNSSHLSDDAIHAEPEPFHTVEEVTQKENVTVEDIVTRPPSSPVPISQRRGLFSSLTLIPEQETALGHTDTTKKLIVAQVSFAAVIAPMGASILLPALTNLADDLHVTTSVVNVSFGLYILSLGIFPLWWSGTSELYGRRSVYVISFLLYTLFTIGCALCKSIAALMILRILSGGAAAAVQAVGAGTIGDIYVTTQRGRAMGYFYLGPLCGPLFAPILGGVLTTKWGWRGTMWFCVILGGIMTVVLLFFLPETLKRTTPIVVEQSRRNSILRVLSPKSSIGSRVEAHEDNNIVADALVPVPSRTSRVANVDLEHGHGGMFGQLHKFHIPHVNHNHEKAVDPNHESVKKKILEVFLRPLKAFKFLKYPPVPLSMVYSSYCFFTLYFLNIGIESLYSSQPYMYKSIIIGLLYIPNSVGYVISSIGNGYWSDYVIDRSIKKHGRVIPEARLSESVYLAAVIFPLSLVLFGWAGHFKTFWLVPLVGTFFFGFSSMLIFGNVTTYLVDVLPGRGSSGVALNNLFRMILAAIATFVADPLQDRLGFGWLYTMLAIGSLLAFTSILSIKKWGPRWRENYDITKLY